MSAQFWVDPYTGYTFSPDRRYWWNGRQWVAVLAPPEPRPSDAQKFDDAVRLAVDGRQRRWALAAGLALAWLAVSEVGPTIMADHHLHFGFTLGTAFLFAINIALGGAAL